MPPLEVTVAYYVSPDGVDGGGPARDPYQPFRSVTGCLDWMATNLDPFPSSETVNVAAGTYSPATGEIYPIMVPPGIDVVGEHRDSCIIEFRGLGDPSEGPCGSVDVAVVVNGMLRNVTITNPDDFTLVDVQASAQNAVLSDIAANWFNLRLARRVTSARIGESLSSSESFWSGGQLYPLIEECTDSTAAYPYGSLGILGGRVERCHVRRAVGVYSPGDTILQDNRFNDLAHFRVTTRDDPAETPGLPLPEIRDNQIGQSWLDGDHFLHASTILIAGNSVWRRNELASSTLEIKSDCSFEDNPAIGAVQICIGWGEELPEYFTQPTIDPQFSGNILQHLAFISDSHLYYLDPLSLMVIGGNAHPSFEGNEFHSKGAAAWILEQAVPDFGGGGSSRGGNAFHLSPPAGRPITPDLVIDIGAENTLMLYAEDNSWDRPGPVIERVSGSEDTSWSTAGARTN